MNKKLRWGWRNSDGTMQDTLYETADAAIAAMCERTRESLHWQHQDGFRLVAVEINVKVIAVLEPTEVV